ncbi:unnamed protein product [Caenorhabditis angaria]|uniref:C-type lectin domain-containing protein n=1 Tax=Caenorhabditis angaria TaxID=860376 RepID=A0A9P1I681_9PELO|nr:unnamed protein product [Caenorhabditis angaria]
MILKVLMLLVCVQLVDLCRLRCREREKCDDGWTYYKRNTSGWCMKVFGGSLNRTQAKAVCSEVGAVMSSIDNSTMASFIRNLTNSVSASMTWLGAELKSECQCGDYACPGTNDCGPNGYYWTDGFTTSNDYITSNLIPATVQYYWIPLEGAILIKSGMTAYGSDDIADSVICGKQYVN